MNKELYKGFVTKEVAVLLEEIGYTKEDTKLNSVVGYIDDKGKEYRTASPQKNNLDRMYLIPHIYDVKEYLREKYNIDVNSNGSNFSQGFWYDCTLINSNTSPVLDNKIYPTYEEAINKGFIYALENWVKGKVAKKMK